VSCVDGTVGLVGPQQLGATCYMDSVLMALLAVPNAYIETHIINRLTCPLATSARILASKIRAGTGGCEAVDCSDFQSVLREHSCLERNYGLGNESFGSPYAQRDAGEFMSFLANFFDLNTSHTITETLYTNEVCIPHANVWCQNDKYVSRTVDRKGSVIQYIPSEIVQTLDKNTPFGCQISNLLTTHLDSGAFDISDYPRSPFDGCLYKRRISRTTVVWSPYLIFYADRVVNDGFGRGKYLQNAIYPESRILVGSYFLELSAIVVHKGNSHGGHYILIFRNQTKWYFYDDQCNIVSLVGAGTFEDILDLKCTHGFNVRENGILYYYV